jgi:methionine-rich copper-binding protein CopC
MAFDRIATLAVIALLTLRPAAAVAHAILLESTPAAHGTVPQGSVLFHLRYNSRIDAARSRLTLTRPDHSRAVLSIAAGHQEDILEASAPLAPGAYSLRWQVLAIDGHITRGDLPFSVTGP